MFDEQDADADMLDVPQSVKDEDPSEYGLLANTVRNDNIQLNCVARDPVRENSDRLIDDASCQVQGTTV